MFLKKKIYLTFIVDKKKVLIMLLVAIIVVMAAILIEMYVFVIRPTISGYVVSGQDQGAEFEIVSIMQQAATCKPIPLTFGNQTINLIAIGCPQPQQ